MKFLTRSHGPPSSAKLKRPESFAALRGNSSSCVALARWRRRLHQPLRRRPHPPPAAHAWPPGEDGGQELLLRLSFRSNCRHDATMAHMTKKKSCHPHKTTSKFYSDSHEQSTWIWACGHCESRSPGLIWPIVLTPILFAVVVTKSRKLQSCRAACDTFAKASR